MKVLVTGGAGCSGSTVASELVAGRVEVVVLGSFKEPGFPPGSASASRGAPRS